MTLLKTDVPIREVITSDPDKWKALENDVRAKILDMLADEEMSIEDIHRELERRGEDKAETTVRHHVNVLKDAGMVEISRMEEAGGGTRKFYRSNTRIFSYQIPESSVETLAPVEETARKKLLELVDSLFKQHDDEIKSVAREIQPCDFCETQHYEESAIRELLERALIDLTETGKLDEVIKD
ncbi:MAG: ArsR/SmtB family transcription factor [Halobacteria archaeon]